MDFPVWNGTTVFRLPPNGTETTYVVDFDNPQQQKVLDHYLVFGIGGSLAFVALLQRYYTKMFLSKGLQMDDLFMLLGWMASVVTQAYLVQSISIGGMCAHSWEMPLERFKAYSLTTYITAPVFMLCNGFTKLSLLTFYLHLSPQKWFRISVWTSIVIVSLYTSIITLIMFFQCSPPRQAYQLGHVERNCINAGVLYMATAVSNIVTDVILFILPIPMVIQLHMPVQQKIGAVVIFAIGSVTVATSIVRLTYLPPVLKSTDPSWDAAPANVWTFVEANLFVICGSMPTLRKFFKHVAPRFMGGSSNQSYPYPNSYAPNRSAGNAMSRARKTRGQYTNFDDENEMQTFQDPDTSSQDGNAGKVVGAATVTVDAANGNEGDSHSEKAILQTTTYTVQYEERGPK